MFTLNDARALAQEAHRGQVDKLGVDYMDHVEAVAAALRGFDFDIQVAGMLHDVVEDSPLTLDDLAQRGVSERSREAIALVSRNLHPELSYLEAISLACGNRDALLVKIADNLHNTKWDRVAALETLTSKPVNPRYEEARRVLWAAADPADLALILDSVAERDVEALLWRVDEDAFFERVAERGFEPLFEVVEESSSYGDGGGMVDYLVNACLQVMPDGRALGLVYGDESDQFVRDWPVDKAAQAVVLQEWRDLVGHYVMGEE